MRNGFLLPEDVCLPIGAIAHEWHSLGCETDLRRHKKTVQTQSLHSSVSFRSFSSYEPLVVEVVSLHLPTLPPGLGFPPL